MSGEASVLYALLGGMVPALLWLVFFLHEDRHPEPKRLVVTSFLAGMLAVVLVIPLEQLALSWVSGSTPVLLWAAIEELVKYAVAVAFVLWRSSVDEPIDAMIYLISVALGFAALETALFLLEPFRNGDLFGGFLTGNLRFLGAALLHTISSAAVGFALAATFYRSYVVQAFAVTCGLVLATALHTAFNFFIMHSNGQHTAFVFFFVWLGVVALLLLFERAKCITRSHS